MSNDYLKRLCMRKEHATRIMKEIYNNQGNPKKEIYIDDDYYQNQIESIIEDIGYYYDDNTIDYVDTLCLLDYLSTLMAVREVAPKTFAQIKAKKYEELFRAIDNDRVDGLIEEYGVNCFVRK